LPLQCHRSASTQRLTHLICSNWVPAINAGCTSSIGSLGQYSMSSSCTLQVTPGAIRISQVTVTNIQGTTVSPGYLSIVSPVTLENAQTTLVPIDPDFTSDIIAATHLPMIALMHRASDLTTGAPAQTSTTTAPTAAASTTKSTGATLKRPAVLNMLLPVMALTAMALGNAW
jgi:hypothetical protein